MSVLADTQEFTTDQDGTLPEGFLFASFINEGNTAALVNGVVLKPGAAKSYPFIGKGRPALPYATHGNTLTIMYDF